MTEAIGTFRNKVPLLKPLKPMFHRNFHKKEIIYCDKNVLMIKNLPQTLLKEDLKLFLSQFEEEPLLITYPRDEYYIVKLEKMNFVKELLYIMIVKKKLKIL